LKTKARLLTKGKAKPAVKFLLNSNGLNVQLRKNGFSYDIYEVKRRLHYLKIKKKQHIGFLKRKKEPNIILSMYFIELTSIVNSNSNVEFIKEQESKDFDNYYNIPNNPKEY
jgi:hypothetical protein